MKKAALYARVSSDRQDVDLSVSAQLKALRKYAEDHEYKVAGVYVDEAESGRTSARPEFKKMIATARRLDRPFDVVLVYKYSRFARSREDSIVFKSLLRKNGVNVISASEGFDDTSSGRMLEGIVEVLDEFYSENLGEEVTRGMRESASRGFYLSAKPPYGYSKVRVKDGSVERTRLEINPEQAAVVEKVFNDVLGGKGLIEIARELNNRLVPGPSKRGWMKTSLHGILTNEVYSGTALWGRSSKRGLPPVRVEGAFPAIVSRETFDKVRAMLGERAPARVNPRRVSSRFLLSGIIHCGYCSKGLCGRDAKSGKFSYYACTTKDKQGSSSCPSVYYNSRKLEGLIVERIRDLILTEKNLLELVALVNEQMDAASAEYRDELKLIEQEESRVSGRLDRLYDALETGTVDLGDLAPRIKELRSRQEQLTNRKLEIEELMSERRVEMIDPGIINNYLDDLKNLLTNGELSERKAFIRSFVQEIIVYKDEVKLIYTMPLLPSESDSIGEEVLPSVRYGGPLWTRTRDPSLIRTVL